MKAISNDGHPTNTTCIMAKFEHETIALDELKLPPHVPKKPSDPVIQYLMRVIGRTGQQIFPILVDHNNVIVVGFAVFAAMQELGAREVGIIRLSNLTPAEVNAIMLLDAKISEGSEWDDAAVAAILEDIIVHDPGALELTGFNTAEIDIAIGNLHGREEAAAEPADQHSEDDAGELLEPLQSPIVQLGDVFDLAHHRIACGNSLAGTAYETLMQRDEAAIVLTDPPYNIPIAGHVSGMGKTQHEDFAMAVGEMSFAEFTRFLQSVLVLCVAALRVGGLLFLFMDRRHLEELFRAVREAHLRLVDLAIWNKLSGGMGGLYRGQHEPCVVAQAGVGPLVNNVQLGKFGRYRTNVWDFRGYSSFGKGRDEALAAHPTVKPWPMLAEIILDCTKRGDIVLDPFLGSGSTILAAEKTSRRCFGIELEPKYVEVCIARWEKMTGKKAVHEATGLTIDELRKARAPKPVLLLSQPSANGETGHE